MVSATKKHAIRPFNHPWRSPRRNSFKSRFSRAAKAAMALRRNDLCGPGETHGSRMIFRASHDEGNHILVFFKVGYDWFQECDSNLVWEAFMSISIGLMALICWLIDWLLHWLQNRLVGSNIFPSSQRTWHQQIWNTKKNHKTCLQTTRCDKKPTS